ncbi:MAG TPA: EamA family transporter [Acidobacteriaceae bacterium]|nr:EamA family transporter [Acidobacteriaceae bacterium]
MTFRRYMVLVAVMLGASLGDTCLGIGMKRMGPVSIHHLASLLLALRLPWVDAGIVLLIGFFASYLTALSWADLSFVLPATSFGNVVVALLAKFWLHEHISPARWAGIILITLGVGFVTQGPSYTDHGQAPLESNELHPAAVAVETKERST